MMDEKRFQLAEVFSALGDPTRLEILRLLERRGETCVCEIVPALRIPQSTVSHHLATLRRAGLVRQRKQRQMVFYALAGEREVRQAVRFLDRLHEKAESTGLVVP